MDINKKWVVIGIGVFIMLCASILIPIGISQKWFSSSNNNNNNQNNVECIGQACKIYDTKNQFINCTVPDVNEENMLDELEFFQQTDVYQILQPYFLDFFYEGVDPRNRPPDRNNKGIIILTKNFLDDTTAVESFFNEVNKTNAKAVIIDIREVSESNQEYESHIAIMLLNNINFTSSTPLLKLQPGVSLQVMVWSLENDTPIQEYGCLDTTNYQLIEQVYCDGGSLENAENEDAARNRCSQDNMCIGYQTIGSQSMLVYDCNYQYTTQNDQTFNLKVP